MTRVTGREMENLFGSNLSVSTLEEQQRLQRPLLSTRFVPLNSPLESMQTTQASARRYLSEDDLPSPSPRSQEAFEVFRSLDDSGRERPADVYQLRGKTISYGTTRIRYRSHIKSTRASPREFDLTPRPANILDLEKLHLFGKKDLNEDERKILMKFDRMEPLINPVRNEPDFKGKILRLMKICRSLGVSQRMLKETLQREAHILLEAIESTVQDTMSLVNGESVRLS